MSSSKTDDVSEAQLLEAMEAEFGPADLSDGSQAPPPQKPQPPNLPPDVYICDGVPQQQKPDRGSLRPHEIFPPCVQAMDELEPIRVADISAATLHAGRKLTARCVTAPIRLDTICPDTSPSVVCVLVEDQDGSHIALELRCQPREDVVPAELVAWKGRVCVVKQPMNRLPEDEPTKKLLVNHVSDIVWLDATDARVPAEWKAQASSSPFDRDLADGSQALRDRGNQAVHAKEWAKAELLYSSAIRAAQTPEEELLAYRNRSLVNLRLGRVEQALRDAVQSNRLEVEAGADKPSEKGLLREATALYELGKFEACLEKLENLATAYPDNNSNKSKNSSERPANSLLERTRERLWEKRTGEYDFDRMIAECERNKHGIAVDFAPYSSPAVTVRSTPDAGRGLFATQPVAVGELLLCDKVFGVTTFGGSDDRAVRAAACHEACVDIIQKIHHNPVWGRDIQGLYPGPMEYEPVTAPAEFGIVDGRAVVDSLLIQSIFSMNSFSCMKIGETLRSELRENVQVIAAMREKGRKRALGIAKPEDYGQDKPQKAEAVSDNFNDYPGVGLWPRGSLVNHSCFPNCKRYFIGDALIVRATRDIEKGEEIRIAYLGMGDMERYQPYPLWGSVRNTHMYKWGFTCGCEMCLERKRMPSDDGRVERREELVRQLDAEMDPNVSFARAKVMGFRPVLARLASLVAQLEETFVLPAADDEAAAAAAGAVGRSPRMAKFCNAQLRDKYSQLAVIASGPADEWGMIVDLVIRRLETSGYEVDASLPSVGESAGFPAVLTTKGLVKKGKARFEIKSWGLSSDSVPGLFVVLARAFTELGYPKLGASVSSRYFATAVRVAHGESGAETLDLCRKQGEFQMLQRMRDLQGQKNM